MPPFTQYPGQREYMGGGNFAPDPNARSNFATQQFRNAPQFGGVPGRQQQWSPSGNLMAPSGPDVGPRAEQSMMYPVSQGSGEAFMRSMGRDMGGPFAGMIDRPHAGVEYGTGMGGFFKRLSTMIPNLGSILKGLYAGQTAGQHQGWMAEDPSQEGLGSRLWASGQSTAGLLSRTGVPGSEMVSNAMNFVSGARHLPEYFPGSWSQAGSRLGGEMTGNMIGPRTPSQFPFFGQTPTAGGEWWNPREEPGGVGAGYSTQNWADSQIPSSFGYERG